MAKKGKTKKKQSFKELQSYWYKKVLKSGFEDVEENEHHLKSWSSKFNRASVVRNWYSKSEYYSMASQFLHNYKFKNNLEKTIWDYHSNAISVRDIADLLKKARVKSITPNKDNINEIIQRLTIEMKRMYLVGYND